MTTISKNRKSKHFLPDQSRLIKTRKIPGTHPEIIEIALERVSTEAERNEQVWKTQENFVKTAIKQKLLITDVFGHLEKN